MTYLAVYYSATYPSHWIAERDDGGLDLVPTNASGRPVTRLRPESWPYVRASCRPVSASTNRVILAQLNA